MSILSFVKRVVASFTKKDVRNKLQQIQALLGEVVRPALDLYLEEIKERTFKSMVAKSFYQNVAGYWPKVAQQSESPYGKLVNTAVTNATRLVELLSEYTRSHLPENIQAEGLTYQKASILRLIELVDFFSDYTVRNLAMLVAAETNITAFEKPDKDPFPKGEMAWLKANQNAYIKTLDLLLKDPKVILATLDDIPEVFVDADLATTPTLTAASSDPLNMGSIAGISWIFHFIGIRLADWDIARYERAQKEKQSIQLRLETLRNSQRGVPDARTQSLIENYEKELIICREKLTRIEERAR